MSRYIPISQSRQEGHIDWPNTVEVSFATEGHRQFFSFTHRNGAVTYLSPVDARDLYYKVRSLKGCAGNGPCFYRHECSEPPRACLICRLGEQLEGLGERVRPDPIPPFVQVDHSLRNCLLWGIIVYLGALMATIMKDYPTLPEGDRTRVKIGKSGYIDVKRGEVK